MCCGSSASFKSLPSGRTKRRRAMTIGPQGHATPRRDAGSDMVLVDPIVGIKKANSVIGFRNAKQRAYPARRIAVIAMGAVEPDMAHARAVEPVLREAVGDKDVVGGESLRLHAFDAALQQRSQFLMIGRDDREAFGLGGSAGRRFGRSSRKPTVFV